MNCPFCPRPLLSKATLTKTDKGWAHEHCALNARPGAAVEPRPREAETDIVTSLVDLLDRIWEVPPMDGQTHAEWKASRVAGSVQALVGIYNIEKRK
jgi:hypothetical protein